MTALMYDCESDISYANGHLRKSESFVHLSWFFGMMFGKINRLLYLLC